MGGTQFALENLNFGHSKFHDGFENMALRTKGNFYNNLERDQG